MSWIGTSILVLEENITNSDEYFSENNSKVKVFVAKSKICLIVKMTVSVKGYDFVNEEEIKYILYVAILEKHLFSVSKIVSNEVLFEGNICKSIKAIVV